MPASLPMPVARIRCPSGQSSRSEARLIDRAVHDDVRERQVDAVLLALSRPSCRRRGIHFSASTASWPRAIAGAPASCRDLRPRPAATGARGRRPGGQKRPLLSPASASDSSPARRTRRPCGLRGRSPDGRDRNADDERRRQARRAPRAVDRPLGPFARRRALILE